MATEGPRTCVGEDGGKMQQRQRPARNAPTMADRSPHRPNRPNRRRPPGVPVVLSLIQGRITHSIVQASRARARSDHVPGPSCAGRGRERQDQPVRQQRPAGVSIPRHVGQYLELTRTHGIARRPPRACQHRPPLGLALVPLHEFSARGPIACQRQQPILAEG